MGDSSATGFVETAPAATKDSAGRFWVGQNGQVKVFDSTGRWIKTLGRPGKGPFEFGMPLPVHTDARGQIHIVDAANRRELVFASDFSPTTERGLPSAQPFSLAPMNDGDTYAMNMWMRSEASAGLTVHVVRGRDVTRSFGIPDDPGPIDALTSQRLIAVDTGGRIFEAKRFAFDIIAWRADGQRIARFLGPALNATPVRGPRINLSDNPLPSEIVAIRLDRQNRLWIVSRRARDSWRSMVTERVAPDGSPGLDPKPGITIDSLYSTRLEVVDLQTRRIMARQDRAELLGPFVGEDLLLQNFVQPDGTPRVAVWRLTLAAR